MQQCTVQETAKAQEQITRTGIPEAAKKNHGKKSNCKVKCKREMTGARPTEPTHANGTGKSTQNALEVHSGVDPASGRSLEPREAISKGKKTAKAKAKTGNFKRKEKEQSEGGRGEGKRKG